MFLKKKKLKDFLKNVLVSVVTLLMMLILTELVLSALDIPKYSSLTEEFRRPDSIRHHSFIPNSYGRLANNEFDIEYFINSIGLRDKEISKEKNKYRILMVGDSFTEGHGVNIENTIPKQLEIMLNNKSRDNIEVINGGVSSYSPILEYLYLKNEGVLLNPDMIILNLDLNDPFDVNGYEQFAVFDDSGEIIAVPGERERDSTLKGKVEHFCVAHNLNLCILFGRTILKITNFFEKPPEIKYYNSSQETFLKTFNYLKKIKNLSDANNIKFVVTIYPHASQLIKGEKEIEMAKESIGNFNEYANIFLDELNNFTDEENMTYIDTSYKFEKIEDVSLYFYKRDLHMTKKGYNLVAQGIFENLRL